jgi:beta-phosphoglucomutase-like phosphatase (HAD superfamily)
VKLILTDCDGVLLDWSLTFREWIAKRGYQEICTNEYSLTKRYNIDKQTSNRLTREFNESAAIGYLEPLRDSVYYVDRIYRELGIQLGVITSLSQDPWAVKAREHNLRQLFGNAIAFVQCLDTGADKNDALSPWKDSDMLWIEDKPKNVEVGVSLGLRSVIFDQAYNRDDITGAIRANNWKEIYRLCTYS